MSRVELAEIVEHINDEYIIQGITQDVFIENIANPYEANVHSLVFISPSRNDKQEMLEKTQARVIICDASINLHSIVDKCLIIVKDPKYVFAKLSKLFFPNLPENEIHPTATVHPEAILADNIYIGPNTYIGKCTIGSNTIIYGNNYLYDNVIIGENVVIQAGAIIGADGCGHIKGKDGAYQAFPHIGRVVIESDVQIGTHSCIAKGALGDTVVKKGVIIDSFVQIGHNVLVEENVLILSNSVIGGSSRIRKNAVLAIGAHICDYVTVGENANIGPGVVIMSDVLTDAKVLPRAPLTLSQNEWKKN